MSAAFSRLQLAAALLEYDNDPDDPYAPRVSAQESAIFAHLRRNPAARPALASRRSDYLGVSLPSETGSLGGRESALDTRRSRGSRGSIDALRNPFAADDTFEESEDGQPPEQDDELEVDLASWGLDAFVPKDKSKSAKGKGKQRTVSNPPVTAVASHFPSTNHESSTTSPRRALSTSRSMSVGGGLELFGEDGPSGLQRVSSMSLEARRRTVSSPLDLSGMEPSGVPFQRRRAGSETIPGELPSQSIPFPTSSPRSVSPGPFESLETHRRTYSRASMMSRPLPDDMKEGETKRRESNATMGVAAPVNDNPFALEPPTHISRFDPKAAAHARTISNASLGSRMLLDNDRMSVMTEEQLSRNRAYSTTRDLLRPKVLVMPSPLQSISTNVPQPADKIREGFQLSADGPPLPPGARTSRRSSMSLSFMETLPPVASNSFIPNPLLDLSLSQKTFRDTLVGGIDGPYTDMHNSLPRATQDGEQVELNPTINKEVELQAPIPVTETDIPGAARPAGKLYGKSLIDDLENRKAQMRSKQRVFTGDQRPSMMAREQTRSSTLIDPASLQIRPKSQRISSYGSSGNQQGLNRRNSSNIKPLLNFEDEEGGPQPPPTNRLPSSRSVFGVDTLWEREMVKLREIQAIEQQQEEERRQKEEEDERRKQGKKKKRGKEKKTEVPLEEPELILSPSSEPRVSVEPPTLPVIQRASRRPPPKASDVNDDEDSESEGSEDLQPVQSTGDSVGWHAGSSDEEDGGPRRTTGVGPRFPTNVRKVSAPVDPESEEDLPLAAALDRAADRAAGRPIQPSVRQMDSDDEQPLSVLLQKKKSSHLSIDFDRSPKGGPDDDDDNQPLGLRASRIAQSVRSFNPMGDDDDDKPLAFHPEQQRRTQYQMMAQQQQQQQQMMMQAQLHNSMFFGAPSVMSSGFFPAPMMNMNPMMMMQPPMSIPSPPPIHDQAKFGRVDRWRRDVAVEGEP